MTVFVNKASTVTLNRASITTYKADGVTLIELMVALSLGLLLVFIMGTLYLSSAGTFRASTQVARVQENVRFGSYFIQQNLRQVGFSFCGSRAVANNHLDTTTGDYFIEDGIFGWEYTGSGQGDTVAINYQEVLDDAVAADIAAARLANSAAVGEFTVSRSPAAGVNIGVPVEIANLNPISGSDILALATERETSVSLTAAAVQTQPFVVSNAVGVNQISRGSIVRVGNCLSSDKFQNAVAAGTIGQLQIALGGVAGYAPGNANAYTSGTPWTSVHPAASKVLVEVLSVYYIGTGASGKPSLFRYESECGLAALGTVCANAIRNEELVEGVENFQVFYGVDTDVVSDGVANQYVTADNVADFSNVVSVRFGLMFRSFSRADAIDTANYEVADEVIINPQDIPITRYVSNSTLYLRNRRS